MFKRASIIAAVVSIMCAQASAAELVPNDPGYAAYTWYGPVLHLPEAWGISTGSPSVIAAVLDTGVIASTPDLAGRVLEPLSATGSPPMDGYTIHHGTWVASVLAMQINNGRGGTGVGDFSILPITVTNASGNNSSDWIARGIRMATDNGARVINISQGTLQYGLLDDAAAYARGKGALTFVAAGNSYRDSLLPDYPNLIFVSGTDRQDARWKEDSDTGSTSGAYVDIAAPAADMFVADPTFASGYGLGDGTSFAAPLAAGAAALAWSINPNLTPDQVQSMLYESALDLGPAGWDRVFGHGRIDIGAVAAAAYATVPEPGAAAWVLIIGVFAKLRPRRSRRPIAS